MEGHLRANDEPRVLWHSLRVHAIRDDRNHRCDYSYIFPVLTEGRGGCMGKMALGIEEISNGFIITGPEYKVYRERPADTVTQAQVFLDQIAKDIKAPQKKE